MVVELKHLPLEIFVDPWRWVFLDDYSNLGRNRTRSQKEKEIGECEKYC